MLLSVKKEIQDHIEEADGIVLDKIKIVLQVEEGLLIGFANHLGNHGWVINHESALYVIS